MPRIFSQVHLGMMLFACAREDLHATQLITEETVTVNSTFLALAVSGLSTIFPKPAIESD